MTHNGSVRVLIDIITYTLGIYIPKSISTHKFPTCLHTEETTLSSSWKNIQMLFENSSFCSTVQKPKQQFWLVVSENDVESCSSEPKLMLLLTEISADLMRHSVYGNSSFVYHFFLHWMYEKFEIFFMVFITYNKLHITSTIISQKFQLHNYNIKKIIIK